MNIEIISKVLINLLFFFHLLINCAGNDKNNHSSNPYKAECPPHEKSCREDPSGFEAISFLHSLIDDDKNGELDREESEEFFREDLNRESMIQAYHHNDDLITVLDLWKYWVNSDVYNWTLKEVECWLTTYVELPQYIKIFTDHKVMGKDIPKLAANLHSYLSSVGVKNGVHRQKLSIKSTDLVLFGRPKSAHNFKKDIAVVLSLLIGLGGCYFAYRQQKLAHKQMHKVMKDLSSLQSAEDALTQIQLELEKAHKEQRIIADDKQNLEKKLKDEIKIAKAEAEILKQQRGHSDSSSDLKVLEDELMTVKLALYEAERRLEENQYVPLFELQIWLQMTYEVERKYFETKREAAQNQLLAAKQMWEKIRKQKSKFLGSIRVAHNSSLDETDQQIMHVRNILDSVKTELQERTTRWQEIEKLCHFTITNNPGIDVLSNSVKLDNRQSVSRNNFNNDDLSDNKLRKISTVSNVSNLSNVSSNHSNPTAYNKKFSSNDTLDSLMVPAANSAVFQPLSNPSDQRYRERTLTPSPSPKSMVKSRSSNQSLTSLASDDTPRSPQNVATTTYRSDVTLPHIVASQGWGEDGGSDSSLGSIEERKSKLKMFRRGK